MPREPIGDKWLAQYAASHTNPINRLCHSIGIPLIALSIPALLLSVLRADLRRPALALFTVGWAFQLIGHAFEKKPPEFLKDWRFLFVGLRWWLAKMRGQV